VKIEKQFTPTVFVPRHVREAMKNGAAAGVTTTGQQTTASVAGSQPASMAAGPWMIALATFEGQDSDEVAAAALSTLRGSAGLDAARIVKRGNASAIAVGAYAGPDDPRAAQDLTLYRNLIVSGARPFAGAGMLAPQVEADAGSLPAYDLALVRRMYGKDAVYTLQVAIYCREDRGVPSPDELAEMRAKAEEAVLLLRKDGSEAFYYHGPRSSTVTVGVFGETDYIVQVPGENGQMVTLPRPLESPRLATAREKHPHNLMNGAGLKTRGGLQPSFLIRIPG